MALKIKEGVEIWAYGKGSNPFTSESQLSQAQLEHLQERFPDDIVDDADEKKQVSKSKNK